MKNQALVISVINKYQNRVDVYEAERRELFGDVRAKAELLEGESTCCFEENIKLIARTEPETARMYANLKREANAKLELMREFAQDIANTGCFDK